MSADHGYRCSRVAFLLVLLWPVVTGRPAAVADPPLPYYDCQGNALTPEEFDALVERLAEIATGYGQVFTAPFGYCDEAPLVIEGLPAACTFAQGWRNYLSDSPEAFLLEPLDVVLFTIDELNADGLQIDPADAQVLRAHGFQMGYLAGILHTDVGERGFLGFLFSLQDEDGVTWSFWTPLGLLSPDDCTLLRELRNCAGTVRNWDYGWDDPTHPGWQCKTAYAQCIGRADNAYTNARTAARQDAGRCLRSIPGLLSRPSRIACCQFYRPVLWGRPWPKRLPRPAGSS